MSHFLNNYNHITTQKQLSSMKSTSKGSNIDQSKIPHTQKGGFVYVMGYDSDAAFTPNGEDFSWSPTFENLDGQSGKKIVDGYTEVLGQIIRRYPRQETEEPQPPLRHRYSLEYDEFPPLPAPGPTIIILLTNGHSPRCRYHEACLPLPPPGQTMIIPLTNSHPPRCRYQKNSLDYKEYSPLPPPEQIIIIPPTNSRSPSWRSYQETMIQMAPTTTVWRAYSSDRWTSIVPTTFSSLIWRSSFTTKRWKRTGRSQVFLIPVHVIC